MDHPSYAIEQEDHKEVGHSDVGDTWPHPTGSSAGSDSMADTDPRGWGGGGNGAAVVTTAIGGGGTMPGRWTDVGPEYLGRWLDLLAGHGDLVRPSDATKISFREVVVVSVDGSSLALA